MVKKKKKNSPKSDDIVFYFLSPFSLISLVAHENHKSRNMVDSLSEIKERGTTNLETEND